MGKDRGRICTRCKRVGKIASAFGGTDGDGVWVEERLCGPCTDADLDRRAREARDGFDRWVAAVQAANRWRGEDA